MSSNQFQAVRFPKYLIDISKEAARLSHRNVSQQITYWAELGREAELRKWQLEQIEEGLREIDLGLIAPDEEVELVFNQCKK